MRQFVPMRDELSEAAAEQDNRKTHVQRNDFSKLQNLLRKGSGAVEMCGQGEKSQRQMVQADLDGTVRVCCSLITGSVSPLEVFDRKAVEKP